MHLKKYGVGNIIISVTGVILNIILISILGRTKEKKPPQILLLNLGIADMFTALTSLIYCIMGMLHTPTKTERNGPVFYQRLIVGIFLFFHASLSSCWLITLNRVLATIKPLEHARYYSKCKLVLHIMASWTYAILTSAAVVIGNLKRVLVTRYLMPLNLAVTLILLVIAYIVIIKAILKNRENMRRISRDNNTSQEQTMNKRTKIIYIHSLFIILNFMVCSIPTMIYGILHSPQEHNVVPEFTAGVTMGLVCITILNPVCYLFLRKIISSKVWESFSRRRKDNIERRKRREKKSQAEDEQHTKEDFEMKALRMEGEHHGDEGINPAYQKEEENEHGGDENKTQQEVAVLERVIVIHHEYKGVDIETGNVKQL